MSHELVTQAARRMRQHRYSEAIALFDAHLNATPDDLVALMQLGICHLLNRSERAFVAIHAQVLGKLDVLGDLPAEVARLWGTYNRLMRNVGATALIVGATPGCAEPKTKDAAPQEASTQTEQVTPNVEPVLDDAMSMHRYSGGVYLGDDLLQVPPDAANPDAANPDAANPDAANPDAANPDAATPDAANPDGTKPDEINPTKKKDATSMHRYSGGVYLEPREVPTEN